MDGSKDEWRECRSLAEGAAGPERSGLVSTIPTNTTAGSSDGGARATRARAGRLVRGINHHTTSVPQVGTYLTCTYLSYLPRYYCQVAKVRYGFRGIGRRSVGEAAQSHWGETRRRGGGGQWAAIRRDQVTLQAARREREVQSNGDAPPALACIWPVDCQRWAGPNLSTPSCTADSSLHQLSPPPAREIRAVGCLSSRPTSCKKRGKKMVGGMEPNGALLTSNTTGTAPDSVLSDLT